MRLALVADGVYDRGFTKRNKAEADALVDEVGDWGDMPEVGGADFVSGDERLIPIVDSLHVSEFGQHHHVIHFAHSGGVDSAHLEQVAAGPAVAVDEEHFGPRGGVEF